MIWLSERRLSRLGLEELLAVRQKMAEAGLVCLLPKMLLLDMLLPGVPPASP